MAQIINFRQSEIRNLPINTTRPAQVGDRLRFTGEVQVDLFQGRACEKPIFIDLNTGDEVVMSVSALMRAKGTIRLLLKNFDRVGEVLDVAYNSKVIFNIIGKDISTRTFASGEQVQVRTLTIDCEN